LALLVASLYPFFLGLNGRFYVVVVLLAGAGYLTFAVRFARQLNARRARQLFLASIIYLPCLLLAMVCDKIK
jgi:protoheme IX farnesyltransferase